MIDKEVVAGLLPVFTVGGFLLGMWLMWLIEVKPCSEIIKRKTEYADELFERVGRQSDELTDLNCRLLEAQSEWVQAESERDTFKGRCGYWESQCNSLYVAHDALQDKCDALEQRCQYLESQRNSLCGIRDVSVEHDALKAEHYKLRQSRDATEFERNALREQLRTIREAVIDDADVKRVVVMEDA